MRGIIEPEELNYSLGNLTLEEIADELGEGSRLTYSRQKKGRLNVEYSYEHRNIDFQGKKVYIRSFTKKIKDKTATETSEVKIVIPNMKNDADSYAPFKTISLRLKLIQKVMQANGMGVNSKFSDDLDFYQNELRRVTDFTYSSFQTYQEEQSRSLSHKIRVSEPENDPYFQSDIGDFLAKQNKFGHLAHAGLVAGFGTLLAYNGVDFSYSASISDVLLSFLGIGGTFISSAALIGDIAKKTNMSEYLRNKKSKKLLRIDFLSEIEKTAKKEKRETFKKYSLVCEIATSLKEINRKIGRLDYLIESGTGYGEFELVDRTVKTHITQKLKLETKRKKIKQKLEKLNDDFLDQKQEYDDLLKVVRSSFEHTGEKGALEINLILPSEESTRIVTEYLIKGNIPLEYVVSELTGKEIKGLKEAKLRYAEYQQRNELRSLGLPRALIDETQKFNKKLRSRKARVNWPFFEDLFGKEKTAKARAKHENRSLTEIFEGMKTISAIGTGDISVAEALSVPGKLKKISEIHKTRKEGNRIKEEEIEILELDYVWQKKLPSDCKTYQKFIGAWKDGIELLELLGAGYNGAVYRAKKTDEKGEEREVAIKIFNQKGRDRKLEDKLVSLEHKNLVRVEEVHDDYCVMEYVCGADLSQILSVHSNKNTLPIPVSLNILKQVAQGLEYAHKTGLLHRDVKPDNILVTPQGEVKLGDFGIASELHPMMNTMTQTILAEGTLDYVAPEQKKGEKCASFSDVYSLAAVAFELFTGIKKGNTIKAMTALNPGVSEELYEFVSGCLDELPENRPQNVNLFLEELEKLGASQDFKLKKYELEGYVEFEPEAKLEQSEQFEDDSKEKIEEKKIEVQEIVSSPAIEPALRPPIEKFFSQKLKEENEGFGEINLE